MINREYHEAFISALNLIHPLGPESTRQLLDITKPVSIQKQGQLLPLGKTCNHIYFLVTGFLRIYYLKHGKEVTEWFADEGEFCFSIESYFARTPSSLCIEAIEDSVVLQISKSGLDRLSLENIEIAQLLIKMYSGSLVLSQQRMNAIQFETARERYIQLEKHHPNIILKAPLQHIASFLGITSETLSRIRANRN